jgi:tetratricopeptide (TPR) repeat protein
VNQIYRKQESAETGVRSRNSSGKKTKGNFPASDKQEGATVGSNLSESNNGENDTFNRHYNKELRVSKDEIPIVLAELNDSAYQFIKREQYERALNLLQKAYGIMDVIDFTACRRDKYHLFIMFHNMALCYQKMQMLEECASCIDQALEQLPSESISLEEKSMSNRMRKLVIIGRLQMQFCAILS